jgi:hypothetical protein
MNEKMFFIKAKNHAQVMILIKAKALSSLWFCMPIYQVFGLEVERASLLKVPHYAAKISPELEC